MHSTARRKNIAIIGAGPSGMFLLHFLILSGRKDFRIDVFESGNRLGSGMPYSPRGASQEHVTNVSANEIPDLITPVREWIKTVSPELLAEYGFDASHFNEFKVFPRLLFGQYLADQFVLVKGRAAALGVDVSVHLNHEVTDIVDLTESFKVAIDFRDGTHHEADHVIICTGHTWPKTNEGVVPGYFDSPYPPAKLALKLDHPVAIKGASLTAIDAIRTLARANGKFLSEASGKLSYSLHDRSKNFKIVMHSRHGLLPAVRFHLSDPHLSKSDLLTDDELALHMSGNDGFLSLDFIFEKDFKTSLRDKDQGFYEKIKDMKMEEFVDTIMGARERADPFVLLQKEYNEAAISIRDKRSVYWKEMLAILSFAMNYPAKHFAAEDMLRLQKTLMPLISVVIAFVPQNSCEELLALHDANLLEIVAVGSGSKEEPNGSGGVILTYGDDTDKIISTHYETYVDCSGQPHLSVNEFPFRSLVTNDNVAQAKLKFRSAEIAKDMLSKGNKDITVDDAGNYHLNVPGITINDNFMAIDGHGNANERIYVMAVPYIGGYNPDYSGFDFCEAASKIIVKSLLG